MSLDSFDYLAANHIVNFDPGAFIEGTTPRYVGSPRQELYLPFEQPLYSYQPNYGQMGGAPKLQHGTEAKDAFIRHNVENKDSNLIQKILLFGALGSLGIYAASKLGAFKGGVKTFVDNAKTKVTSLFNSRAAASSATTSGTIAGGPPAIVETAGEAATATSKDAKGITNWFTNQLKTIKEIPNKGKKAGIGAVALLGLYGLYKIFGGRTHSAAETPTPIQPEGH